MKYVIVTGGVISGLGKGITASSLGRLLIGAGYKVTAIKIDPYLNCDAGTMNPIQHGEVFVLDDGGEADLDLGNYERFLDINMNRNHNITTGKVYRAVLDKERRGDYLGKTVQIIPHITDEIRQWIKRVSKEAGADICIVEVGGTVGDIESMPFLEAARELHREVGHGNLLFLHTTLIPIVGAVGEQKTKPTQHSVMELRRVGIQPDMIVGRCSVEMEEDIREKIAMFCDVPKEAVISAPDAKSIYEVPLTLERQGALEYALKHLGLEKKQKDMKEWREFVSRILEPKNEVSIAVVGKYTHLHDSYLSIIESFRHAGAAQDAKVSIVWIEAEDLEQDKKKAWDALKQVDGVLIPGGFGSRGTEGKMIAIKHARENKIPLLGICYGFQLATVEFCRNVLGWKDANTTENDPKTKHPVVFILPEQKGVKDMGGTMRLGLYPVNIANGTKAHEIYGKEKIEERHRHRYEINPKFIAQIEKAGIKYTGRSPDRKRMEILELKGHPYFIASQFHPEFKSRPGKPSPLFAGLVKAALERKKAGKS
ncbi:MAG: CTP synthase (glutamine hydrolyzing) [Candidatus Thermoplasmatota archaeon]|nr:CTP synthase (glutamine hydrolyzing) [Candidatus Thermoplasmatota archaeon]